MYYICSMAYITIKEFADIHNVTESAVRHAIKAKRIKAKLKYGRQVISENAEYNPHTRGLPAVVRW